MKFKYGPLPVPILTGEAAERFVEMDKIPLTPEEKERNKEAYNIYMRSERKRIEKILKPIIIKWLKSLGFAIEDNIFLNHAAETMINDILNALEYIEK